MTSGSRPEITPRNGSPGFRSPDCLSSRKELEQVLSRYSPVFCRVALRQLGNAGDVEDALQDALFSPFKHASQFAGRCHISTWLTSIVINSARMNARRQLRHTAISLDETDENERSVFKAGLVDSGPSPEEICSNTESHQRCEQLLECLSPMLPVAFQLRHMDGLSAEEAADALGVTRETIKSRVLRARAKLSHVFRDETAQSPVAAKEPQEVQQWPS